MIMSIFKLPLSLAIWSMERGDIKFNQSHKTFGTFNIKKDLSYIVDDKRGHKLDIYTPVEKNNGITIFYVHGGGYVYGWKEAHQIFISWFVNLGFSVVAPNYRLGQPEGSISFIDQLSDIVEALKFTEENKVYYGIKTDNLFLLGDSAGGHLCLMLDVLLKSKEAQEYYQSDNLPKVDIKGIALNSTMYDFNSVIALSKKMLSKKGRRWMFSDNYLNEEFIKKNSPRYYYRNGFKPAPLFASTATHDYFNSQTLTLKRDADELGIDLDYLFEASPRKDVGHVYNHFIFEDEEGKRCNKAMEDFFYRNSKVDK